MNKQRSLCVNTIDFEEVTWMSKPTSSPTLYSVRRQWEMIQLYPGRVKMNGFSENNHFKNMNRIDGRPTEFEWPIFTGITTLGFLEEDSKSNERSKVVNLSTSNTGSTSCQRAMTLNVEQKELQKDVNTIHRQLRVLLVNSLAVIGLSWSFGSEKK